MGDDNQKLVPTANKINKWFFAFLSTAVVCLALLVVLVLWDGRMAVAAAALASDPGATPEPTAEGDQPSAQAKDVVVRDSVQSIQLLPSAQSVQSAPLSPSVQSVGSSQGTVGLAIADIEKLQLADLKERADLPAEWRNVLLLGSDSRDMERISLTDTIIIVSINKTTGELKLTSILRDTVVPITGRGLQRINTAAYYGGPSLMMQVINENFGMNITEYVLVNFAGMAKAIDALGGIRLDIDQKEMMQINQHMGEIARYTMTKADYLAVRDEMKLKAPGSDVPVNGIQAVSYARIRSIDSDAARTGRQRIVIGRILERAKDADAGRLMDTAMQIWGNLSTNIDVTSAMAMVKDVLAAGEIKTSAGFTLPDAGTYKSSDGALIDVDTAANTLKLYDFIYGTATP